MPEEYDLEERVLFWAAGVLGVSIDKAYRLQLVRLLMKLSAILRGKSSRRPR